MNQYFTGNFRISEDRKKKNVVAHMCVKYVVWQGFPVTTSEYLLFFFPSQSSSSSIWVNNNIQEVQTK